MRRHAGKEEHFWCLSQGGAMYRCKRRCQQSPCTGEPAKAAFIKPTPCFRGADLGSTGRKTSTARQSVRGLIPKSSKKRGTSAKPEIRTVLGQCCWPSDLQRLSAQTRPGTTKLNRRCGRAWCFRNLDCFGSYVHHWDNLHARHQQPCSMWPCTSFGT